MSPRARELAPLLILIGCAAVTVALANVVAGAFADAGDPGERVGVRRAANVRTLPKQVDALPPRPEGQVVLLMGNSHTYALPGLRRGESLRPDPGATLIDEIARRTENRVATPTSFERLAYPNFLPFEMLSRVVQLLAEDHRPDVVILGLTWRNIARDSRPRHEIRTLFRDTGFVRTYRTVLDQVGAPARLRTAVDEEARRVAREVEQERLKSDADRADEELTAWLGDRIDLFGSSAAVRARVYRAISLSIGTLLVGDSGITPSAVVDDDLALNVAALRALLDLLDQRGVRVVLYQAPERSDLPPMTDTSRQQEIMTVLRRDAEGRGFVMLDARRVVPDRFWGFDRDTADRSHFTEPGHRLLAEFLVEHAARAGTWDSMARR